MALAEVLHLANLFRLRDCCDAAVALRAVVNRRADVEHRGEAGILLQTKQHAIGVSLLRENLCRDDGLVDLGVGGIVAGDLLDILQRCSADERQRRASGGSGHRTR